MKFLARLVSFVLLALACAVGVLLWTRGGGRALPDRSGPPTLSFDAVEKVADLDYPPGNIAVSRDGRVFLTLHPDGRPPLQVVELVDGRPVPFPDEEYQRPSPRVPFFQSILSIRIDRQDRLWVLDFAGFGRGTPRLLAFDIATRRLVHEHVLPDDVAGLGSMLNDFQVDADGSHVYIAETSPLLQTPAILVHDTATRTTRRLLDGHRSVQAEPLVIHVDGRPILLPGGLLPLRIAVDSIALSRDGQWLWYGAVSGSRLYRIRTSDLLDTALTGEQLGARVEAFADKTLSDGITTDDAGNVYLSDMEHSAIHRLRPDRSLETLVADPRLRWPDGFSFGPDGWLYVTCSALQDVLFRGDDEIRAAAPYQVWRLRPGATAEPGH